MSGGFPSKAAARLALARQAAASHPDSAALRLALAQALAEAGAFDEFASLFKRVYAAEPMTGLLLGSLPQAPTQAQVEALHARATALAAHGAAFAPVIAALAVCEALLGRPQETRRLVDYERFFRCAPMDADLPALAAEIKSKLDYSDRHQGNTGNAWFHNGLTRSPLPASRAFTAAARRAVERYIAALGDDDHPFVRGKPKDFVLHGWGVVATADSRFEPHIHPQAWISGVYYVTEPKASQDDERGWLRVGPPARHGIEAAWQEKLVPPRAGQLVLMPGYFFHETRPLGADEERISIAFDVVPAELASDDR